MLAEQDAMCWFSIVDRIVRDQPDGLSELIDATQSGIRFHLVRRVGHVENLDALVSEVYAVAVQDIRAGVVPQPAALVSHLRMIANRVVQQAIEESGEHAMLPVPVDTAHGTAQRARTEAMTRALERMPQRDRQLITRFYDQGQTPEQICKEMNLTTDQFRTRKAKAKAVLSSAGQRAMADRQSKLNMPIQLILSAAFRRLQ